MANQDNTRIAPAIPKTSRRLFIAAGSAGAVFGALGAAVAATSDDPVFAAIAEHRRCKAFSDQALAICNRIGRELDATRDAIAVIRFDGEQYYTLSHLEMVVSNRGRLSRDEITEFFNARRALEKHEAALRKAWDESGIHQAEDTFDETNGAHFDAEMAVLSTRPVSQAGAMALLHFIPQHLDGPHSDASDDEKRVADAIRNAVAILERGEA